MRVLFLINGLGTGGAERSLAEMLPVLRDEGVHTTVACLHRRDEGVQSQVQAAGFDVRFVRSTGWVGRLREVRRLLRRLRPDILHTTIFESDVVGRFAAVGRGCIVVSSLVNTSYDRQRRDDPNVSALKLAVARTVDGWSARHLADHHHAITGAVRDSSVRALGIDPGRVTVIPRGRDGRRLGVPSPERRLAAREALGVPTRAQVIVNVGRQEHQKGHVDLLAAMAILARRPDVLLLQAGRQGHASKQVSLMCADPLLRECTRLLGHRDDVPQILAAGDVFAFPSLYEGLGGAVIEAMALGLPIVATSVPALREVVEEGGNALLIPPGKPAHLAEALDQLLGDPGLLAAYGRRSRALFEERFTLERSVDGMLALYQGLLRG